MIAKDSNITTLNEGDNVQVIKDLKVKGSSSGLKRGTIIRVYPHYGRGFDASEFWTRSRRKLAANEDEIEGHSDKIRGLS